MATATQKTRAGAGTKKRGAASMEFLIDQDNGGTFHWTLFDRHGKSLGRSSGFASYKHAHDGASVVIAGAASARLDLQSAEAGDVLSHSNT
jgi:uncharacterized protein YegP (UPF0339 family)